MVLELAEGGHVVLTGGTYKGCEGLVLKLTPKKAHVKLRGRDSPVCVMQTSVSTASEPRANDAQTLSSDDAASPGAVRPSEAARGLRSSSPTPVDKPPASETTKLALSTEKPGAYAAATEVKTEPRRSGRARADTPSATTKLELGADDEPKAELRRSGRARRPPERLHAEDVHPFGGLALERLRLRQGEKKETCFFDYLFGAPPRSDS